MVWQGTQHARLLPAVAVALFFTISCHQLTNPLLGKWYLLDMNVKGLSDREAQLFKSLSFQVKETTEFFHDGTVEFSTGEVCSYKFVDDTHVRFDCPKGISIAEYRLSGTELTLSFTDNFVTIKLSRNKPTPQITPTPVQQPVIQQPTPQPQQPIIIQQPTLAPSQPPVIVEQPVSPPASSAPTTVSRPSVSDDAAIQSEFDKRMAEDATLSSAGVMAIVSDGKVTLTGSVDTQAIKNQVERLVRGIKGVKSVDNQITVSAG